MKDRKENNNKLLKENEELSKEQLARANELFREKSFSKENEEELDDIREIQYRLNARKKKLLTKALGTDIIFEDEEIRENIKALKKAYSHLGNQTFGTNGLVDDCNLPDLSDDMDRRIKPGVDYLTIDPITHISGTNDQYSPPGVILNDPDEAEVDVNGASIRVSADSINEYFFHTHAPVIAKASLRFPLAFLPTLSISTKKLAVRSHIQGNFRNFQFDSAPFGTGGNVEAWIKINISSWDQNRVKWIPRESKEINLFEGVRRIYDYGVSAIPTTTFEKALEIKTESVTRFMLVTITAEVQALAEPYQSNLLFGPEYNAAHSSINAILCAADIGLQPIT